MASGVTDPVNMDAYFDVPGPARMYVIVDKKLSSGAKAAQAGHALMNYSYYHPEVTARWQDEGNVLIILQTDRGSLQFFYDFLFAEDFPSGVFFEPDFNYDLTAVAVIGNSDIRPLLTGVPLAKSQGPWGEWKARRRENKMRKEIGITDD